MKKFHLIHVLNAKIVSCLLAAAFCGSNPVAAQNMPSVASIGKSSGLAVAPGNQTHKLTEEARRHPDFGTVFLPDSNGKEQVNFVELTDLRTEFSATFHDFATNNSCVRQSGDVPLHYKDASGLWRNVEEILKPTSVSGVYEMSKLKFPLSFDSNTGASAQFLSRFG